MTIQEKFEEVKDHPMVVLLLKYYNKKCPAPIPLIWQDFIKNSTESSSLDLMYLQLPKWKIAGNAVPPNLRGAELLNHLLSLKFNPVLDRVQTAMTDLKLGFVPAMEALFRETHIVPPASPSNSLSSKYGIETQVAYQYVETGTLRYSIVRKIPATIVIPANFIRECFGPEHSDGAVLNSFNEGMKSRFRSARETRAMTNSLSWILNLLHRPNGHRINDLSGQRASELVAFPRSMEVNMTSDEPAALMRLHSPQPDPLVPETVTFSIPRAGIRMDFPILSSNDQREISETEVQALEPPSMIFSGINTSGSNLEPFIAALRAAHSKVTEAETYKKLRKAALEEAANAS